MRKRIINGLWFIIGIIVTILLTWIINKYLPDNSEPIIFKEVTDSIIVIHTIDLPSPEFKDDSLVNRLAEKVEKLELLKNYQDNIEESLKKINESENKINELESIEKYNGFIINIKDVFPNMKGYSHSGETSFITKNCPEIQINDDFVEIQFRYIDESIADKVGAICVSVLKINPPTEEYSLVYVAQHYFKSKHGLNKIRITNEMTKGNYRLTYGILLLSDKEKESPTFHKIDCIYNF